MEKELILMILLAILISSVVGAIPDAAEVYCDELGYEYRVNETEEGQQGICVIKEGEIEFDAWDFFQGNIGDVYYVRPLGGNYGKEDGTSYENAFVGFDAIKWDEIMLGDTLYVCGEFYNNLKGLSIGASGIKGALIEIRGDCKAVNASYDDGFIWSGFRIERDDWDGNYSNVWYKNNWWRHSSKAAEGPIGNETLLQLVSDKDNCSITEGSFYHDAENSVIYYNPVGDFPKDFWTTFGAWGAVNFNGHSYIAIRNLTLRGASGNRGVVLVNFDSYHNVSSQHWEITGCDIGFGSYTGIYSNMDSDFGLIENNTIHDLPSGTYFISAGGVQSNNVVFRNNEIYSGSDRPGIYGNRKGDRQALGGQCGDNLLFEYNYIHDWIGEGINVYIAGGENCTSHNVTIRYNRIMNLNDGEDAFYHWGIVRATTNKPDSTDRASNWQIYYNIIHNCGGDIESNLPQSDGIAIRIKSGVPENENITKIYNNVFSDCNIGFLWQADVQEDEIGFDLKNNIFLNHKGGGYHVYLVTNPGITDHSHVKMDYNNYFDDNLCSFKWEGGKATDFLGFKEDALSDGVSLGEYSIILDPQLTDDFYLQSTSPGIDAGVDVGLTRDFGGNPVLQGSAPDIGVYEYNFSICSDSMEVCDGVDNDCDGSIDEFLSEDCGEGDCLGERYCLFGGLWTDCTSYGKDCGVCCECDSEGDEEYDETQDNDCPTTLCPTGCDESPDENSYTIDIAQSVENYCTGLGICSENICEYEHYCFKLLCNAECEDDDDCDEGEICDDCICIEEGPVCGDGEIEGDEECELPGDEDSSYCEQSIERCDGYRYGARDDYGDCGYGCECVEDRFEYSCVMGECGAECASDSDCSVGEFCLEDCSCADCVPSRERCDGRDNDCDGSIDEGVWQFCGQKGCYGITLCVNGGWGDCSSEGASCGVCKVCDSGGICIDDEGC